ncbi:uncharacterized protein RB166_012629 [Leptodactylus fuscus]|uniref:uncharacterized protein LOC142209226 n=1 Tax=Leptodactylus fuscus TaxID=238119 RepID=UPI003F4E76F9
MLLTFSIVTCHPNTISDIHALHCKIYCILKPLSAHDHYSSSSSSVTVRIRMKDTTGSLFFGTILLMMSIKGRSCDSITQHPSYLELVEGDSGTFSCSVRRDVDLRVLSLDLGCLKILELCDFSCDRSDRSSFHGTIENLQDVIKVGNKSTCTDLFKDTKVDRCSSPSPKNISNESPAWSWIWVSPRYSSRIYVSGDIFNLSFSLKDLRQHDSGSYSCHGFAYGVGEDIIGGTQLTVTKGSGSLSLGTLVAVIIAALFLLGAVAVKSMYDKRAEKRDPTHHHGSHDTVM